MRCAPSCQQLRSVSAEKAVRLHGQSGEAIACACEARSFRRGSGNNSGPEGLLLQRIQDNTAVAVALIPGVADKGLPVLNFGGLPCRETLGAAHAVECLA